MITLKVDNLHLHVNVANVADFTGIHAKLDKIIRQEKNEMAKLDTLTEQVAQVKTVEESAIVLINGLAAKIVEAGTDQVALDAIVAELGASKDALAAAVSANTIAGA